MVLQAMIIAALRYWVQEMHVDGFRFDLGSIMTRAHSVWHPPTGPGAGHAPHHSTAPSGNGAPANGAATAAATNDGPGGWQGLLSALPADQSHSQFATLLLVDHPCSVHERCFVRIHRALVSAAVGLMQDGGMGVPTGTPLARPPLIEAISEDPILCRTKLIAEAWDCGPLMQVGPKRGRRSDRWWHCRDRWCGQRRGKWY